MAHVEISYVITDSGDGSNGVYWVKDPEVIERMQQLADDGNELYASGDGLQLRTLKFPGDFDLDAWIKLNHIYVKTLEDVNEDDY